MPYSGCDDNVARLHILTGKAPQRPSDGVTDLSWEILEKCWKMDPSRRPSAARVYNAFARLSSLPPEIERLPGKLLLQVEGIKISPNKLWRQRYYVRFRYGHRGHTTPLTMGFVADDEYIWFGFRPFPPSLPPLNLGQGPSRYMADKNQQTSTRTDGLPRSAPPCTCIQGSQGLRNRVFLRKSVITPATPNVVDRLRVASEQRW